MPGTDYRIAWRPKALEDLRSIVRYIAQDSPTRARTFGKKLREKVQPLAQHPLLGHEGRPGLPAGVRELVLHANYIAFYRVIDTSRTVEILRVKHVAQHDAALARALGRHEASAPEPLINSPVHELNQIPSWPRHTDR